ncbi:NAD(P)-dependent alcohol dehydrogenase [Candidatus Chloroploca sp. Khr17]|uniref:NAD(P)-dependent alcohol dehydrogenase n=1 Tax=Candidatus Chloroploca sp. Khr17 TaxID=2496869 RepID=UPI00101B78CE|nr:NAD(P)-dependent alcohol dehydrogenase [Candidatus Chloroploca sp. Khr17]
MRAVVYTRYGPPDVLHVQEIARPGPSANEVLIKVYATTVTIGDCRMRSFTVPPEQWLFARLYLGIWKPRRKILGMELAGEIEAVGPEVTRFKVGDPVFASTFEVNFGGYAEYKCLPEEGMLALKPAKLSFEEAAAAVGGGITALRCLERGRIQPGQQVLIYGASGAVGTSAVQLASRHFGAEVTGVCSTANLDLVQALGAVKVIDYTRDDFRRDGPIYDVVFDAVAKLPPTHAKKALKPTGIYLNVHKHSNASRHVRRAAFLALKELIEAGKLKPVIDRVYPLEQIVAAHRYVDQGHKKGNVVISVLPA